MVEGVSSVKLFATMLLHMPYCEKLILANVPPLSPHEGLDPGLQTKTLLDIFQYILHLCLHAKIGKT